MDWADDATQQEFRGQVRAFIAERLYDAGDALSLVASGGSTGNTPACQARC